MVASDGLLRSMSVQASVFVLAVILLGCGTKADLRLNQVQMLHCHNSYHLAPGEATAFLLTSPVAIATFPVLSAIVGDLSSLIYTQPNITEQLNKYGVRSLELDVYPDPEGGLYRYRAGPKFASILNGSYEFPSAVGPEVLDEPGFKVFHIPDWDFNTRCYTLIECLSFAKRWHDDHPRHEPLYLRIEAKSLNYTEKVPEDLLRVANTVLSTSPLPGATSLADTPAITTEVLADLEAEILSVFNRSEILTPDDLMGDAPNIWTALGNGSSWPSVSVAQGKIILVMVSRAEEYLQLHPHLKGALAFVEGDPNRFMTEDVAIMYNGDSTLSLDNRQDWDKQVDDMASRLAGLVSAGYMMRGPVDVATVESRANYLYRAQQFIAAGVQHVHTDYPGGWTNAEAVDTPTNYTVYLPGPSSTSAVSPPVPPPPPCVKCGRRARSRRCCVVNRRRVFSRSQ